MEDNREDIQRVVDGYYQDDLKKLEKKDIKRSWVSTSGYLFYLTLACLVLFTWGGCYRLYTKRFEKPTVNIQESTLYTPKYKN